MMKQGPAVARTYTPEEMYKYRKSALGMNAPASGAGHAVGGTMGDIIHKSQIDEYGSYGALAMDYLWLLLTLLFNTNYFEQVHAFNHEKSMTFEMIVDGDKKTFSMAYDKNSTDPKPPIYPIDPFTNEPDFSAKPLKDDEINSVIIMLNGYVPAPSTRRGLGNALRNFNVSVYGQDSLSSDDTLKLYGRHKQAASEADHNRDRKASDIRYLSRNKIK